MRKNDKTKDKTISTREERGKEIRKWRKIREKREGGDEGTRVVIVQEEETTQNKEGNR